MAHVLFDGDIQRHPALRSLFWQWGMTVGRLEYGDQGVVRATVEDCDAVVQVKTDAGGSGNEFGAMPDGAETEGVVAAAAPLLVIGAMSDARNDRSWITIPGVGPGGSRLKAALQSCLARTRELRGDTGFRHERSQFRDFLGHELRSPLTAVKTALTAMGEVSQPDPGAVRMLRLALRNLRRLADTVEWSQELMALAEEVPAAELVPVPATAVVKVIPDHLEIHLDDGCKNGVVLTDLCLLGILTRQMVRVFSYAFPGNSPVFRLEVDPAGGDYRLGIRVAGDDEAAAASRVARAGGEEAGRDQAAWNRAEFDNLTRMLISPQLLQVLGVKTRLPAGPGARGELSIGLPMWSAASSPALVPLTTA